MGRKVALAIGVGDVPDMAPLPAARRGARRFCRWATSQGFDPVVPFIDDNEPVERRKIEAYVERVVNLARSEGGSVDCLFIYFAGHGVVKGVADSVWLLSHAGRRQGEAVDVALSWDLALYYSRIPHVAFFGDTCRTRPDRDVSDDAIFPPRPRNYRARAIRADQFYAAYPEKGSFEGADDPNCVGIWTYCLLQALEGRAPEACVTTVRPPALAERAVVSESLERYLEDAVPIRARQVLGVEQWPCSHPVTRWQPHVMSWVDPDAFPPPQDGPDPDPLADSPGAGSDSRQGSPTGSPNAPSEEDRPLARETRDNLMASNVAQDAAISVFETTPDSVHRNGRRKRNLFMEVGTPRTVRSRLARDANGSWSGPTFDERSQGAALIHLDSFWKNRPLWSAAAVFPGYATAMRVDDCGVQYLAYLDSRGTTDIELVARMTARARLGVLSRADNEGMRLSLEKHFDPTMAVLLAHSLHRTGEIERVGMLLGSLRERSLPIPFDVALLANHTLPNQADVVPGFPLATRGWTVLRYSNGGAKALAHMAAPHLAPAYWTTLFQPSSDLRYKLLLGDP
ncbi:caspase family protein [Streptomyces sp. NPDC091682]|uniref:caspase family protein n=1 Tax=Streptomyces sp. NPDC091682 TaxID=3366005 RepID=UPI00380D7447